MPVDDGLKRCGEPSIGIDSIELASFNERREYRPVLCSGIVTGKEGVLSVERDWADGALDGIVVQFDATVFQELAEAVPVFGNVFEGLSEWRFGRDAGTVGD